MPRPTSFNWSSDFTTLSGLDGFDATSTGVFKMFWNALNERACALAGRSLLTMPAAGAKSLQVPNPVFGTPGTTWLSSAIGWDYLIGYTDSIQKNFVRRQDASGNPWTIDGQPTVLNTSFSDISNTVRDRPFPYPNGWTRTIPRTIYTLSQAGTLGQRTRFQNCQGESLNRLLSTDPNYLAGVTTPTAQIINSGKFFDYTLSGWTLSADQSSSADILTEHGLLPQAGDYLTGQLLNDLRDAINQLTLVGNPQFSLTPAQAHSNVSNADWTTTLLFAQPNAFYEGHGTTAAAAQANSNTTGSATAPAIVTRFTASGPFYQWTTGSMQGSVPHSGAGGSPPINSLGQTRSIQFYGWTNSTGLDIYDTQGITWLNYQNWAKIGAAILDNSTSIVNGDVFPPVATPGIHYPPDGKLEGFIVTPVFATMDYAVTGGFKYVSGYAGT